VEGAFFAGAFGHGVKVAQTDIDPGVELNIYHIDYFRELIRQQVLWAYIVPFYPKSFAWVERSVLKVEPLQRYCFAMNVANEVDYKWDKARYMFTKQNDRKMAAKAIVVGLRYLLQAQRFLAEGSISDFSIGNDIYHEVKETDYTEWKQLEGRWKALSDKLRLEVMAETELINGLVLAQPQPQPGQSVLLMSSQLYLLDFIKKYGVDKCYSVRRSTFSAKKLLPSQFLTWAHRSCL